MDEKHLKGNLSEIIALKWLTEQGYVVYTKMGVQSPFDLVAYDPSKEKILLVDVKTAAKRQSKFQHGTTIRRIKNDRQKELGVVFLYVYLDEEERCELIL